MTTTQHRSAILVNYVGYPSSIDSLMPDNGLANLAGSLKRSGWSVYIADYATVEMIGRLVPDTIRARLTNLYERFQWAQAQNIPMERDLIDRFQEVEQQLSDHAYKVQQEIAEEIVAEARARRASMIGFKLWIGAGQKGSQRIGSLIKKALPEISIYGGGPHVTFFGGSVLEDMGSAFDAVATGEGEEIIDGLALCALGHGRLDNIPGIFYWQSDDQSQGKKKIVATEPWWIEDLDQLADPCYDEDTYPAVHSGSKLLICMLDESRGCPYSCNFCIHRMKSGSNWRTRKAARVVDQLERIRDISGAHRFRLAGSNPPPEHRREIANELVKRKTDLRYTSFGHTRTIKEDYQLLRQSGCVSLFFGVESGCQRILDEAFNKRTSVDLIRKNLIDAKQSGIITTAGLIVPAPFDTHESMQETIDLACETALDGVSVYLPVVVPGTTWYWDAERFGFKLDKQFDRKMRHYQIRFIMPPPFWDPLPYTMCGRTYCDMVSEASWISSQLERRGVLTGMHDSIYMLAKDLSLSPIEARDLNRKLFMTADHSAISELIARFNEASTIRV